MPKGGSASTVSLKGMSKAWHMATRPCSADTEASAGGPMTSPAAKTPATAVRYSRVHDDPAARVEGHAGGLEAELLRVAAAAGGEEDLLGVDRLAVGEGDAQATVHALDARARGAEEEAHAHVGEA